MFAARPDVVTLPTENPYSSSPRSGLPVDFYLGMQAQAISWKVWAETTGISEPKPQMRSTLPEFGLRNCRLLLK